MELPEFTTPDVHFKSVNLIQGSHIDLQDLHYSILRQILSRNGQAHLLKQPSCPETQPYPSE